MDRGIFVALSGAVMQEKRLEFLADNLANVKTAGFKKQQPLFRDAMPSPYGPRTFSTTDSVVTDMGQGMTERTDRPLDVAIKGDGFFVVNTPFGTRYTRDGSFVLATDGSLRTREGYAVEGERGQIRLKSPAVVIDASGAIESGGAVVDRFRLVTFASPEKLVREGNLFAPTPFTTPEAAGASAAIEQGYIETSNVNAVRAMTTMIEAIRSFETQTKMIQTIDEMTRKSIEDVGR